jgi:hypothetical protein
MNQEPTRDVWQELFCWRGRLAVERGVRFVELYCGWGRLGMRTRILREIIRIGARFLLAYCGIVDGFEAAGLLD